MADSTSDHTPSIQHHVLQSFAKTPCAVHPQQVYVTVRNESARASDPNQTRSDWKIKLHPQAESHNANISKRFITEDTDVALTVSPVTTHKL